MKYRIREVSKGTFIVQWKLWYFGPFWETFKKFDSISMFPRDRTFKTAHLAECFVNEHKTTFQDYPKTIKVIK